MKHKVILRPMTEATYVRWRLHAEPRYAESLYETGGLSRDEALEKSKKSFEVLLPQGFRTKEHLFFSIIPAGSDTTAGMLWVHLKQTSIPSAYIYEFEVDPDWRGKGLGRASLLALEPLVKQFGATSIALHVFAKNAVARNLYESAGYVVTSLNLRKDL